MCIDYREGSRGKGIMGFIRGQVNCNDWIDYWEVNGCTLPQSRPESWYGSPTDGREVGGGGGDYGVY